LSAVAAGSFSAIMGRPFAAFPRQLSRLVHPAVAERVEVVRHAWFIGSRLACGALGLGSLPILLALNAAVAPATLLVVIGLVLQAFTALMVSRSGRLAEAHALSLGSACVVVVGTALAGDGLLTPALALLPLLVVEAGFLGRPSGLRLAIVMAMVAVLAGAADGLDSADVVLLTAIHLFYLAAAAALATIASRETAARILREKRLAAHNAVLMEGFGELLTRHDAQGHVRHAGTASLPLLGATPASLLGRGLLERVHVADRPQFLVTLSEAAGRTGMADCVVRMRRGAHEERAAPDFIWVEVKARRLLGDTAEAAPAGEEEIVCLLRDVSARKRYEDEIEAARANAESASAMKDRFLATVSHELRTPLNAIIGFSELLADVAMVPADDPRRPEYAQIIKLSGEHLLGIVNTLLDLSRIDGGTFQIEAEPFEVAALVDSTLDLLRLKAEQGKVSLSTRIEPGLPPLIADRRACRQILLNLVSNAVKFTPEGGQVTVEVRREGEQLILRVQDTGIGIAPNDLPRVGEPFFQARSSYDRPYEGTGLGFSVVRGLVALHSGHVTLDSTPGKGTCATVRLGLDTRIPLAPIPLRDRDAPRVAEQGRGAPRFRPNSIEPVKKRA
jgi:cell cycle sensor histidine kinase DivJ